ncbi:membrane protein insertion efficiency factor YidD [Stratiformator vulcanicus]|uniref:Putative membrane protein insertion efficiency factor n=1 Tax=Stratiformator vulcanicus TaxID=2527980 RepID=A0A517QX97_9PLAN|nr:membrane protein insertion efficiency factor YidD [Stratiformator vulcanicus]QDT36208.1 Putative membrane protein insertion efficiency factor [Stratiformator vulcanicus]
MEDQIGDSSDQSRPRSLGGTLWRLPGDILIAAVRVYQVSLGLIIGGRCRFHPSCSNYFIQAVRKYGAVRGAWKGLCRIGRCHPFHPGGYDPP